MENIVFCLWILSSLCTKTCTLRIRRLVFFFGLLYLCSPVFASGQRSNRSRRAIVMYNDTCSTDCSQISPRFYGDTTTFECTVGYLSEVKKFREKYKNAMNSTEFKFESPKLIGIDFYHKHFKDGATEAALNISFLLPKGKVDGYQKVEYPIAVLLHFQSVEDPKFQDSFYYKNPRERIFQFWNHKPKTLNSSVIPHVPRSISYDCLVGLEDSKPATAYTINLATAFGLNVTYYCTVYAHQGRHVGYTTEWLPTIATYFNLLARSVHVVFEEYTLEVAPELTLYYIVSLVLIDDTVVDHKKIYPGKHETTFTGLKRRKYYVRVSKCVEFAYEIQYGDPTSSENADRKCISATSYVIDATPEGSPAILSKEGLTLSNKLVASLSGVLGLTVIAMLIIVFRRKCTGGKKPIGWTRRKHLRDPCTVTDSTRLMKDYGPASRLEKQNLLSIPNTGPRIKISDKPSGHKLLKFEQDRHYADPQFFTSIKSSDSQSATLVKNNQNTRPNTFTPDRPVEAHFFSLKTNTHFNSFSEIGDRLRPSSELRTFRSYMNIFAKINDSRSTIDTLSSGPDEQTEPRKCLTSVRSYMSIFARINDSMCSSDTLSFVSDESANVHFEKEPLKRRLSSPDLYLNSNTCCNERYSIQKFSSGIEHYEEDERDNVAAHSGGSTRNVPRFTHIINHDGELHNMTNQESQKADERNLLDNRTLCLYAPQITELLQFVPKS